MSLKKLYFYSGGTVLIPNCSDIHSLCMYKQTRQCVIMCSCGWTCSLPCMLCVFGVYRAWLQQTHTSTLICSSWQIKMNTVVFGSGSSFIIFHFAQCASQTPAAACHVKTLYQALTAPPLHTHIQYAWLIHPPLVLKPPPTDSFTYVGNICSDLSHYHSTLAHSVPFLVPCCFLISHLVTSHSSYSVLPLIWLSSATCQFVTFDFYYTVLLLDSLVACMNVFLSSYSETWKLKELLSYLGCGQSVCWPISCFWEHFDIKSIQFTSVMMNWLKSRILFCIVMRPIVLSRLHYFLLYTGYIFFR